jgi:uncharacterized protein YkwD
MCLDYRLFLVLLLVIPACQLDTDDSSTAGRCRVIIEGNDANWPQSSIDLEDDMLRELNARRAAGAVCGGETMPPVPALASHEKIRVAARLHSADMADRNYFDHDSFDGCEFDERMEWAGYTIKRVAAENIQAGSPTAVDAVDNLMGSPSHCMNIMNGQFELVGIGYASSSSSGYGHYWTQDFAGE